MILSSLKCGYSTMASASAFQAEDEGSIPFTRSIVWVYNNKVTNSKLLTFLTLGLKENMLPVYIVP